MDQASLRDYLLHHDYFHFLRPDERERLLGASHGRLYQTDETIFAEAEPASGIWWIESGTVKIYKLSPEGSEHILHLAGAGETFNDIAVFDHGANPAHTAALSPAKIWHLPAPIIQDLVRSNPDFSQAVIKMLAQRVRNFAQQIGDLTLYSVTPRLARFLLQQAESNALEQSAVTRKAIAGRLATTPETISRTLRTLQETGAIQFDRYRILIVNEALLRDIAML
jgi:CRP-like cAMP-binding protein